MNKNLFRLVFNAARGQVMAVSEVASSHSGSQSTASAAEAGKPGTIDVFASNWPLAFMDIAQAAIKSIVAAVAMVGAPAWLSSAVWAQAAPATTIVVNTAAPAAQQPTVTHTSSGVTQVNIQTAVGGVSRNRYTQFDVGSPGLILNNSAANSNTQLGGWVQGNTNLASGSAGIILNEVNSANPSQLRGYIEVAGQRAEVVIANPAGISVNGGGFINASGATLTTGTPQFSGNSLTGYQVNGGTINVTGTGLDTANTGITTLQARQIILQGAVHAQDLRVTADNTGGTPNAVAIDVAAIGGMYANKITILATGQGAGVNNAGTLQANSGSFTLSADGTLTNTGTINSTATTRINADTVNNSTGGAIYGNSVAVAATTLNNAAATSTDTAPIIATRDSAGRVDIGVTTLNNQEGALIYGAGALAIGGGLDANGQAAGRAATVTNNSATLEASGNVAITTQTLANTYTSLSYRREVDPDTPATTGSAGCGGDCTHTWVDTYYRAVAITGPNGAAVIRSGADIVLDTSNSVVNSSSQILAAGTLSTSGATLDTHGIDLTTQVATHRDHTVVVTYMENGIDCPLSCRSERRWRYTYSTDLIARDQTIGPAVSEQRSTSASTTVLPNSALFAASNNNRYLVETNPAFTNKQVWLSSDAMLAALSVDPDTVQKRLGDGFYEQRLINEQVAQLTGYRRLANYTSDEQQYQALMNAGVTFALAHQLRPGIALTAEQVASLTSDIVWLETREVTVPGRNGEPATVQKVLLPQVYAVARAGDLATDGSLLSGNIVNLNTTDDISNRHASIQGRELVSLNATNVRNLAGRIEGKDVSLNASQDIENIGGAVIAQSSLSATAGRDILVQTTTMDSRSATPSQAAAPAGSGDILVSVGAAGVSDSSLKTQSTDISRVAGLYVTDEAGTLLASAGRDVDLVGALLQSQGSTTITAARNLNLATVTTSASIDATKDADNYNRSSRSAEVGSTLQSTGNTTLTAGQDIKASAADVQAAGNLTVTAGNHVVIESGIATSSVASASKTSNSGFMSSSTRTERSSTSGTQAIASNFGGKNVAVTSGQDIGVKASNVVADQDLTLAAAGKVTIEAGTNTQTQTSFSALSESGLMSSGGLDVSIGTRDQSTDQKSTRTTAAASTVGSTGGNVIITAGKTYTQTGSDVLATGKATGNAASAGNIAITAKKIDIVEARETSATETKTEFKQSGITLALSNPIVSAVQTMQKMATAAENTKSDRMKALAAGSAVLAGYGAYTATDNGRSLKDATTVDKAGGISINLSIGASSSESSTSISSSTARGSTTIAAGDVNITAKGAGSDSNLLVQGSTVSAGNTANLRADNQVQLLAATNTSTQTNSNNSSNASMGVGFSTGSKSGITINASVGKSQGSGNGQDVTYTNTQINAGRQANITSGGDTTLQGSVVTAQTVNADVGGNLSIQTLQDKSTYSESSSSSGAGVSVCVPPLCYGASSANINASKTDINSNYQSANEQTGIKAGDGGFQVSVHGNTELKGGVIASNDKAIADNRNSLSTGTLTTSDLNNEASASATTSGFNLSTDMLSQGKYGAAKGVLTNIMDNASQSGSSSGQTKAAISAGTVRITDGAAQTQLTGNTGGQTIASLNRDTQNANTVAQRQDVQTMKQTVEAERAIKNEAVKQLTTLTDEAYRVMFKEVPKFYKVTCPANTNCTTNPEKAAVQLVDKDTQTELANAPSGAVLAVNGIDNPLERAGQLAMQNAALVRDANDVEAKPTTIYLMHYVPANNGLSELMIAAYEKSLASTLGYSNQDEAYAAAMQARGQLETTSLGHSRGTIVQTNANNILSEQNFTNPNLSVRGVGGAVTGEAYTEAALKVAGVNAANNITFTYFKNDPVPVVAGGNSGVISLSEFWKVLTTSNSAHSCYGTGAAGCSQVEILTPSTPKDANQKNSNLIRYVGGKPFDASGKPLELKN